MAHGSIPAATPAPEDASRPQRTIGILGFSMVAYFLVCGGPFGMEVAVSAAGPGLYFLALIAFPILWSVPQALVTAEMSSLMDDNGGYVTWTQTAFGDLAGWVCGCNGIVSSIFDLALYPTLFASYLDAIVSLTYVQGALVRVGVVVVCFALNVKGLEVVSAASAVLTVLILVPFFVLLIGKFGTIVGNPNHMFDGPGEAGPDLSLFVSTMMWSYTGWDSLGCIAGEVQNVARTFAFGTVLTLILVTITYGLPVVVCLQLHPDMRAWTDGGFVVFLTNAWPWLGAVTSAGALLGNLGMFNAEMSANSRAVWALAGGDKSSIMPVNHVPSVFAYLSPRFGTPTTSLLFHAVLVIVLTFIDSFSILVTADMLFTCVRLVLEISAFVKLRYDYPKAPAGFKIPGGWPGVLAVTLPKLVIVGLLFASTGRLGWAFGGGFNVVVLATYFARKRFSGVYSYDHQAAKERSVRHFAYAARRQSIAAPDGLLTAAESDAEWAYDTDTDAPSESDGGESDVEGGDESERAPRVGAVAGGSSTSGGGDAGGGGGGGSGGDDGSGGGGTGGGGGGTKSWHGDSVGGTSEASTARLLGAQGQAARASGRV